MFRDTIRNITDISFKHGSPLEQSLAPGPSRYHRQRKQHNNNILLLLLLLRLHQCSQEKALQKKTQTNRGKTPLLQQIHRYGQNLSRSGGQRLDLPAQPLRQGLPRHRKIERGGQSNRCSKNRVHRKSVSRFDSRGKAGGDGGSIPSRRRSYEGDEGTKCLLNEDK